MHATDIGIVYHDGIFTFAARTGAAVNPITQHNNVADDAKALALLLRYAEPHWRQLPSLVIAGNGAQRLLNGLYAITRELPAGLFDWLAAPSSSKYKNQGSEAIARLKQALDDGTLILTADDAKRLAPELAAFELIAGESKPRYTLPDDVAGALNQYPARALALALVSHDPRPLSVAVRTAPSVKHQANSAGYSGHDPMSGGGHDPLSPFGHRPH